VRTAAELVALAARPEPLTIAIEGTIEVPALLLTSDKTLVGVDREATLAGGIAVRGTPEAFVSNVIIANLNIAAETSAVDGDGIQVHYAHHVWVDHCALRDAADGLLDIVHGSDFVTVSHTRFSYTPAAPDPDHRFAALVGHDRANGAEDRGHLNVTWHHDFWGEGVSLAVSGRFGSLHVFNSLFQSPGGAAVLSAGLESSWLVENNRFEDVEAAHTILLGSGARLAASGNVYVSAAGARDATAGGFVPAYPYVLESPFELAASIEAGAGPR
jgi:pectate lyase